MSFIKSIVGWFKRKKKNWIDFELEAHDHMNMAMISLDLDINRKHKQILEAKRKKQKSSHLQKQLEGLVARKLELEGK